MSLKKIDSYATSDIDDSTMNGGALTPPETVVDNLDDLDPLNSPKSSVPWPGSCFIIRSANSGKILTLLDGKVVLESPCGRGLIYWACVQAKGWIGFKSTGSGRFLGHDLNGNLRCSAQNHLGWENFCVRMTPDGHYTLLMTHWERLYYVGIKEEPWGNVLAKISERIDDALIWEFVKV